MKEKTITASEISGELRRAARMYKVFAKAAETADLLAGSESVVRQIKKDIEILNKEKATLDKECNDLVKDINLSEKEIISVKAKLGKVKKDSNDAADAITAEAIANASDLTEESVAKVQELKDEIKGLKSTISDYVAGAMTAKLELSKIVSKVKETKEAFLRSLGV